MMRALKLIECIAVGSELGVLLTIKGVGRASVKKIIESGIEDFGGLENFDSSDLANLGVKKKQAELIVNRVQRSMR